MAQLLCHKLAQLSVVLLHLLQLWRNFWLLFPLLPLPRGPLGQDFGEEVEEQAGGHCGGHHVGDGLGEEGGLRGDQGGQQEQPRLTKVHQ